MGTKLPNPNLINRKTPTPGGPSGYLRADKIGTPSADTSIGDALMRISEDAHKFAMVEKARMDDVAIDDAKNQYLQQTLDIENEYNQIKGKSAVDQDIVKDYTTKLDGVSEKISSGFKNDSQRRAWDSYYGKAKVQFTAGVMRHKLNESDTYAAETYKSTNILRVHHAISNWSDTRAVNSGASDIVKNIAKEKIRAGWGKDRTEVELRNNLGPMWGGIITRYTNAKQYKMARDLLNQHEDILGDRYGDLYNSIENKEIIDLSQEKFANIIKTVDGDDARRKAARDIGGILGDATLDRIKTFQNEERIQRQENKRIQSENDLNWVNDTGLVKINEGTLTIDDVNNAKMSPENTLLWKQKVYEQGNASKDEADNIFNNIVGQKAQDDAANKFSGKFGKRVKKNLNAAREEEKLQKEADKVKSSEYDSEWISEVGVVAFGKRTLTVEHVKLAGLSDKNEALWITKVNNQIEQDDKTDLIKSTNDKYADWLEKVSLEPEKYTPEDVAKDVNPNDGGLTGPQYTNVLSILSEHKTKTTKTTAKSAEVRGKSQIKAMYDRGDFGKVETGEDKYDNDSWNVYSNLLIDYQQKYFEEPDIDHTDWLNNRIEEEWIKPLYKDLDDDWTIGPFRDESTKIISRHLLKKNIIATPEIIDAVRKEYQLNKTGVAPEAKIDPNIDTSIKSTIGPKDPLGIL